jgi:hypothetical protein
MAGDWIKVEKVTARKPEVMALADSLSIHVDHAFGLCVRFWSWCDDQMTDGHALRVTNVTLDSAFGHAGFADALVKVGWLRVRNGSLEVPNFDRHLSESAKKRALSGSRKQKQRAKEVTGMSRSQRDKRVTREEEEIPPPPQRVRGTRRGRGSPEPEPGAVSAAWPILRDAWNAGRGVPWGSHKPPDELEDRLAEPGWLDDAIKAIGRIPRMKFFRTPPTLLQLVGKGFVERANGGGYDELTPVKPRHGQDDRPPPREWDADTKAAFERTRAKLAGGAS